MDEFDRIMSNEPVVLPSEEFTRDVMRTIRREAAAPPPLEFPWRRFLPGAFTAVALTLGTFVVIALAGDAGIDYEPAARSAALALVEDPTARGIGIQIGVLLLSLAGTAALVRRATRGPATGTF